MNNIRPAAVAGLFYPESSKQLHRDIQAYLTEASYQSNQCPKAVIVPHAGYVYSGIVAGAVYSIVKQFRDQYQRVVLLGPCHYVGVRGLALPTAEYFSTPLGDIPIDKELSQKISHLPQVITSAAAHAREHSLEVQLPFLQEVLDEFTLLPLVVGQATVAEVAEVLSCLWGVENTLFVISSDLSHFLAYEEAKIVDSETSQMILAKDEHITPEQACGCYSINGLLHLAKEQGLSIECIDRRNSGDTAGNKDRVVGYGSYVLN